MDIKQMQSHFETLLAPPPHHSPYIISSLRDENERLQRVLCTLMRQHLNAKKELEDAREILGFNRTPFPFLQLPREVRDEIYGYALTTPSSISTASRELGNINPDTVAWKPPCPNLCLVNKQIHYEASKVMYSKNSFSFTSPRDFTIFEDQIGLVKRDFLQRVSIPLTLGDRDVTPDPNLIPQCDWDSEPTYWALTLRESQLSNITEMRFTMKAVAYHRRHEEVVTPKLAYAIEDVLSRRQRTAIPPLLVLTGINSVGIEMFPSDWRVSVRAYEDMDTLED